MKNFTDCINEAVSACDLFYLNEVVRKGNNTIYQIVIPMSEINAEPGKPLYFDFVVFDNNSKTATSAPYWLDMDDGLAGNRDNAALPLVIFDADTK